MGFAKLGFVKQALSTTLTYIYAGLYKVFAFFSSGWQSYVAMVFIVVSDHWETLVVEQDLVQTVIDIGTKLGRADRIIADSMENILMGAEGISYLEEVFALVVALFTILWVIRTVSTLLYLKEGSNISPMTRIGLGVFVYLMTVIAVQREMPTAVFDLIGNLDRVFEWERAVPWIEGNYTAGVNETVNQSAN